MENELIGQPVLITRNKCETQKVLSNEIELTKCFLYSDSTDYIDRIESENYGIYIIGYILDTRNSKLLKNEIIKNLLSLYIEDETEFLDNLNYLNGRFIILINTPTDTRIYVDSTNMKPIFYYEDLIFCTHEKLLVDILKSELKIEIEKYPFLMNGFLDYSNYINIFKFNPNMTYSFQSNEFSRIFPYRNFDYQTVQMVLENTLPLLNNQVKWLDDNYKYLYLSLTGGIDSKTSMALSKSLKSKIKYFTYMTDINNKSFNELNRFNQIYYQDKYIVDQLVYNFDLDHQFFYLKNYIPTKNFLSKLKESVSSQHSYKLAYILDRELKDNSIHIKSTIYGMAKMNFGQKIQDTEDTKNIIDAIAFWAPKEIRENRHLLEELYLAFADRTEYSLIDKYNYPIAIMLLWEFRMSNWHSNITQETDFKIETFVFMNTRFIIDQLISLNNEDRKNNDYLMKIIKSKWPALNYFLPNSFLTLED